jgi:hypothetical protein
MYEGFQALIYPVESSQQDNNNFGTGFIIRRDGQSTYFLTCAHVVESVGMENILIDGMAATVTAIGTSDNLDLAVLCVQGLQNQSVVSRPDRGKEGDPIIVIGIYDYGNYHSRKSVHGQLGVQSNLKKPKTPSGWINAWDLKMDVDDFLQPGYSGSPVINETNGKILGIVSHRQGVGSKGLAISIEAFNEIWQLDMPDDEADREPFPIHDVETEHIQKKVAGLRRSWDTINQKIEGLKEARVYETRPEEIDRLSYVIEMTKRQQVEFELEISTLVERLQKLDTRFR